MIASPGVTFETARAGVIVPVEAFQVRPTKGYSTRYSHHAVDAVGPRARSVSPPATPAAALWVGDKIMWRESRLY
jgi:hypothetical protein